MTILTIPSPSLPVRSILANGIGLMSVQFLLMDPQVYLLPRMRMLCNPFLGSTVYAGRRARIASALMVENAFVEGLSVQRRIQVPCVEQRSNKSFPHTRSWSRNCSTLYVESPSRILRRYRNSGLC